MRDVLGAEYYSEIIRLIDALHSISCVVGLMYKGVLACGDRSGSFRVCMSFFRPQGEKTTYKDEQCSSVLGMVSATYSFARANTDACYNSITHSAADRMGRLRPGGSAHDICAG